MLVAPEHRASLQLKRDEIWEWGGEDRGICKQLDRISSLPYVDIVDEVDALLSHK